MIRALLYGDVDMNLIDGSSIWLQSTTEVLARAGCDVTLMLKARVGTTRLIEPLAELSGVRLVRPFEDGLPDLPSGNTLRPVAAAKVLRQLDDRERFDLVVLRGRRIVDEVVRSRAFDHRLWTYLTDIPQSIADLDDETIVELEAVAEASRVILCQTEELRAFLESTIGPSAGRLILFPPVVPQPDEEPRVRAIDADRPVRLVYSGKFSVLWRTLEMTALPARLAERGVTAELEMIGDKIIGDPDDPTYRQRMETALADAPGVVWHGGKPRSEAIAIARLADIGLGWRHRELDASLELSTKILEYGSVGLPIVLNRTPMHEALLGVDYPLFASTEDEVLDVVTAAVEDAGIHDLAAGRCIAAARAFTLERAVERVSGHLARAFPTGPTFVSTERPLRVGVASHDLKFFTRILDHLEALPAVEVRVDQWPALSKPVEHESRGMVQWADVIICEWCGPNAVWYGEHRRPDQRLIVRLHRFELDRAWPRLISHDAVDQLVCVSPYWAGLVREQAGWPASKVVVVPNLVDDVQLDRPKLPGAEFHLGLIGMAPALKRLDRAVEVLDRLRARDPRFMLFVKSKLPWEYSWIWRKPAERRFVDDLLRRIEGSERLRQGVVFDRFGSDVATWLRRIGFVLSTSDLESFHLAPAEGMASGSVPMLLRRPGVETIFDERWIHEDPAAMADHIYEIVSEGRWDPERRLAQSQVREAYGLKAVLGTWERLLVENLEPAAEMPIVESIVSEASA